jgi:phosphonate transport system substrate-binding protein
MRKDLPETTKGKLRQFFYTYGQGGTQEKEALMKLSKLSGFQQSSNKQLVPIRQLELFREKTKLQADATMPETERAKKLAEIDRRLAELNEQLAQKQ